jgi:hypothetical protein
MIRALAPVMAKPVTNASSEAALTSVLGAEKKQQGLKPDFLRVYGTTKVVP